MSHRVPTFALAGLVLALDRISKLVVRSRMEEHDAHTVVPGFFNLVRTENRGIAFGLFNDSAAPARTWVVGVVSAAVLVFVAFLLWKLAKGACVLERVGLALVLGGALGNLYDRIVAGSVTDFLEFHVGSFVWPAFNVADSAITTGAGLLILSLLRRRPPART